MIICKVRLLITYWRGVGAASINRRPEMLMNRTKKQKSKPDRRTPGQTSFATPAPRQAGVSNQDTDEMVTTLRPTQNFVCGTWNVETLWKDGRLEELIYELDNYKWNIIGLSEVRRNLYGEIISDSGHKLYYSGQQERHLHGVGFLVNKNTVNSVIGCEFISSRLMTIRLKAKPFNITLIQIYAPTSDYDDEEVEVFYQDLQKAFNDAPNKDIKIILGDWNAKIGKDSYHDWTKEQGIYCNESTNDRGLRLLEFARYNSMVIANTLGKHKEKQIMTWSHPNNINQNQIDYILVQNRFRSSIKIKGTRAFPKADVGSPHNLVLMSFKLRLQKMKKPEFTRLRFDLEKLKDPSVIDLFQANIGGKFAPLLYFEDDKNVDDSVVDFEKITLDAATDILGKKNPIKKPWITKDIFDLCDERRNLKSKKKNDDTAKENYSKINKTIKKKITQAKENYINEQCSALEESLSKNDSKKAYGIVKDLTTSKKPKVNTIKDKNGKCLTEKTQVLNRWTEYSTELYNYPIKGNDEVLNVGDPASDNENENDSILKDEIIQAIKTLKSDKSPGFDNIPGELIKAGGEHMIEALHNICNKIWSNHIWPSSWTKSLVITLPKKGDLQQCNNYRTLSLISHPSKILLRIILNRLKPQAAEIIAEEQAGFMPGRSTVEQIFNLRVLCEKSLEHQQSLYHVFIDFKKAFDRVWHQALIATMKKYNISSSLISLIENLYSEATSAVFLNGEIGDWFRTSVGVRQGCLLSPTLFNIFLERIMTDALSDHTSSVTIGGRPISNLRFADDIDGIAGSEDELIDLINRLDTSSRNYGMEISPEKTKIMANEIANGFTQIIKIKDAVLEPVDRMKYLGALISDEGSKVEILSRIAQATGAIAKLKVIWQDKSLSIKTKIRFLRSLVMSIFLYASESWTLTAEMEKRITSFEYRCYRKLLNIPYNQHVCNSIVRERITESIGKHCDLLQTVKTRKLKWFGHVSRQQGLAKTILQGTLPGSRKKGRPRKK